MADVKEEEEGMSKFGVDEQGAQKVKQASKDCPQCGSDHITKHGHVVICDNCGTAPFEGHK